jgi:hypothetical protein
VTISSAVAASVTRSELLLVLMLIPALPQQLLLLPLPLNIAAAAPELLQLEQMVASVVLTAAALLIAEH